MLKFIKNRFAEPTSRVLLTGIFGSWAAVLAGQISWTEAIAGTAIGLIGVLCPEAASAIKNAAKKAPAIALAIGLSMATSACADFQKAATVMCLVDQLIQPVVVPFTPVEVQAADAVVHAGVLAACAKIGGLPITL